MPLDNDVKELENEFSELERLEINVKDEPTNIEVSTKKRLLRAFFNYVLAGGVGGVLMGLPMSFDPELANSETYGIATGLLVNVMGIGFGIYGYFRGYKS
ncbi:hypothetical protein HQ533_03730 [Candidatus Woesearchaeota archaeon]|nr:hypothetical protein [Candidatus Woesearchaeota archaeon]